MMWLTYREAARRVHRSTDTIRRWKRRGMPMRFDALGRRVVDEKVLLSWFRERLKADPVHQARLRARARANEEMGNS